MKMRKKNAIKGSSNKQKNTEKRLRAIKRSIHTFSVLSEINLKYTKGSIESTYTIKCMLVSIPFVCMYLWISLSRSLPLILSIYLSRGFSAINENDDDVKTPWILYIYMHTKYICQIYT